jgi:hypothetical protein
LGIIFLKQATKGITAAVHGMELAAMLAAVPMPSAGEGGRNERGQAGGGTCRGKGGIISYGS